MYQVHVNVHIFWHPPLYTCKEKFLEITQGSEKQTMNERHVCWRIVSLTSDWVLAWWFVLRSLIVVDSYQGTLQSSWKQWSDLYHWQNSYSWMTLIPLPFKTEFWMSVRLREQAAWHGSQVLMPSLFNPVLCYTWEQLQKYESYSYYHSTVNHKICFTMSNE